MSDDFSSLVSATSPLLLQNQNLLERFAKNNPKGGFAAQLGEALNRKEGLAQGSNASAPSPKPASFRGTNLQQLNAPALLPSTSGDQGEAGSDPQFAQLMEAAHQMETQLTTFMLKSMDEASDEGGLLGNATQGMGYFRDVFFQDIASKIVENKGLGFAESLRNAYGINTLAS